VPQGQDQAFKDKDLKLVLKESSRTRTRTNIPAADTTVCRIFVCVLDTAFILAEFMELFHDCCMSVG